MFYARYFADLFYKDENDFFWLAKLALKKKRLCGEEAIQKKGGLLLFIMEAELNELKENI